MKHTTWKYGYSIISISKIRTLDGKESQKLLKHSLLNTVVNSIKLKTYYQLVFIGVHNEFKEVIFSTFQERIADLGLDRDCYNIISRDKFTDEYKPRCPTVCLYFGGDASVDKDIIDILVRDAVFILPVVSSLDDFGNKVPEEIKSVNGFELININNVEALVSRLLEGLSLLRASRRLFISYRRKESRSIAIQLYEYLDARGFDVFLDTNSIRPGDKFQDELWHRLVDTDVVVLLDTPKFLESRWTEAELTRASALGIAILQLIWPERDQEAYSTLCTPHYLNSDDFGKSDPISQDASLSDSALALIASETESLRARNLASRQDNLIQEFISSANNNNIKAYLQPERFITVNRSDGKEVAIIPTIGVPQSLTFNQTEELIDRIRKDNLPTVYLLYDHRYIVEKWQKHLIWLDLHLPVKTRKIMEVEDWITKI